MNIKSILAGTLAAATIMSAAGGGSLFAAPDVRAQSADLQAQIAALLAQVAALQAQLGGGTACYTFTSDLTLGSNGEAVRALQVYLNAKGYAVATAGPGSRGNETTYFGGLTRSALARYQAAVGISPAAGYFGPITRARVNADCVNPAPTPNPNPTPTPGNELRGGEADLSDYRLRREQSTGAEGENGVAFAEATFDVDGGDVRIERIELIASSTNAGLSRQPWRYFESIGVRAGDRTIATVDADSRADWNEIRNGVYRLTITGLRHIVREGDRAELTLVADIASSIDTADQDQEFSFSIQDRGIRAIDAAGIQQYVGNDNATVTFGFEDEQSGDLRVKSSGSDPDASILVADEDRESGDYLVFAFEIQNRDDVDALVRELSIDVTDLNGGVEADDVIRRATLRVGGDTYAGDVGADSITFDDLEVGIDGDDEETFELRVRLARNATSTPIGFSVDSADIEAEGVRSGDDADVAGSASSELHTIAYAGIQVSAVSATASRLGQNDTVGQYTIVFRVTAVEEDAYIATTSDTTGTVGVTFSIGGNEFTGSISSALNSSAERTNGFFVVEEGDTETFTLTVSLDPDTQGIYDVRVNGIRFAETASFSGSVVFDVSANSSLRTQPILILD